MTDGGSGTGTIIAIVTGAPVPIQALLVSGSGPARMLRGISGQSMTVPTGTYWVQAVLPSPAGQCHMTDAEELVVQAGASCTVSFDGVAEPAADAIVIAPAPPPPSAPSGILSEGLSALGDLVGGAFMRLRRSPILMNAIVHGDLGQSVPAPGSTRPAALAPGSAPATLPTWRGQPVAVTETMPFLRVASAEREWLCVVPIVPGAVTTVSVALPDPSDAADFPLVSLRFADGGLDRLWQFANTRSIEEARALALLVMQDAGAATNVHAALACYVLLRVDWNERLLDFIRTRLEADPAQPDLWVGQAELLSRLGRHGEAARSLLRLGTCEPRWPLFRPGIEYAKRRLTSAMADGELPALAPAQAAIAAAAAMMDPTALVLVLRTRDPEATARDFYPARLTGYVDGSTSTTPSRPRGTAA